MKKLINRIFNRVPREDISGENMEIVCNNPPGNLSRFCSNEYGNMKRRSY